jgi:hypothetical protein
MLTDYLHDEDEARDDDFLIRRAAIWPILATMSTFDDGSL